MCAQVAHASMAVLLRWYASGSKEYRIFIHPNDPAQEWLNGAFTKIVVGAPDLQTLFDIQAECIEKNIPHYLIKDAGKTEFKEPTYTCIAVGPYHSEDIDKITGDLKLL